MNEIFKIADNVQLDEITLQNYITNHKQQVSEYFKPLYDAYENKYAFFDNQKSAETESDKPDNCLAVNFAKYITDVMNHFFIGIPIKMSSSDNEVNQYLEELETYNNQNQNNVELSKMTSIFGRGYEMYSTDENNKICIANCSPLQAFMIYEDTLLSRPKYFVRYYTDINHIDKGIVCDTESIRYFSITDAGLSFDTEAVTHGFNGVPAVEYRENDERQGIFETVLPLINEYNKILSEKAEDAEYFADAYLKISGVKSDDEEIKNIRSNRIINIEGDNGEKAVVEFLERPDSDSGREELLNRLERLIFTISMVPDMSDVIETESKYKLFPMCSLFKAKEKCFTDEIHNRYQLIFSNSVSGMEDKSCTTIQSVFTPCYPGATGEGV